jgi:acyl carrier protein
VLATTDLQRQRVKEMLVDRLRLKLDPSAIDDGSPLFRDGLGLDSIDALEVVIAVEQTFGVTIEGEKEGRRALQSVETLTRFLVEKGGFPE